MQKWAGIVNLCKEACDWLIKKIKVNNKDKTYFSNLKKNVCV